MFWFLPVFPGLTLCPAVWTLFAPVWIIACVPGLSLCLALVGYCLLIVDPRLLFGLLCVLPLPYLFAVYWPRLYMTMFYNKASQMDPHVSRLVRPVTDIKNWISNNFSERLIHALMKSRLDYCNALLGGCSARLVNKLQLVQNAAARVLIWTRKYDHIIPVLSTLHWRPIKHPIHFKILLITYKWHRTAGSSIQPITTHQLTWVLTLWGLRVFWGPGEVLTCPDICAFFSCFSYIYLSIYLSII